MEFNEFKTKKETVIDQIGVDVIGQQSESVPDTVRKQHFTFLQYISLNLFILSHCGAGLQPQPVQ